MIPFALSPAAPFALLLVVVVLVAYGAGCYLLGVHEERRVQRGRDAGLDDQGRDTWRW